MSVLKSVEPYYEVVAAVVPEFFEKLEMRSLIIRFLLPALTSDNDCILLNGIMRSP